MFDFQTGVRPAKHRCHTSLLPLGHGLGVLLRVGLRVDLPPPHAHVPLLLVPALLHLGVPVPRPDVVGPGAHVELLLQHVRARPRVPIPLAAQGHDEALVVGGDQVDDVPERGQVGGGVEEVLLHELVEPDLGEVGAVGGGGAELVEVHEDEVGVETGLALGRGLAEAGGGVDALPAGEGAHVGVGLLGGEGEARLGLLELVKGLVEVADVVLERRDKYSMTFWMADRIVAWVGITCCSMLFVF